MTYFMDYKILIAEDSYTDAEICEREVKKVFPTAAFKRTDNKEIFTTYLNEFNPDIIISDYSMPAFTGMEALKITQQITPLTPVIIVTGSQNEDIAVECMKAGAVDYVLKEHIKRLGNAIKNALIQKEDKIRKLNVELALLESEERYRTIIENITLGVVVHVNNEIVYVNNKMKGMIKATDEKEIIGFSVLDFVHPDDKESVSLNITNSFQSSSFSGIVNEERLICFDKSIIIVEVSAKLIDFYGEKAMMLLIKDITDRKKAEENLSQSESNYKEIFNSTNEAIFIHDIKNGLILDTNETALKIFGFEDKEALIKGGINLLCTSNQPYTEIEAKNYINKTISHGPQVFEWLAKKQNGELFWVEVSLKSTKIRGEGCVLAVVRDINDRKNTQNQLKKINECLLNLGLSYEENINTLTNLLGELFGATCTLYNRLVEGMLCSIGQWNTPSDFNPIDKPEGHICYDVIQKKSKDIYIVRDLQNTMYFSSDPNVKPYKLQTYIGKAVVCENEFLGSLCAVFQKDFIPTEEHDQILTIIATAIGMQETRKKSRKALLESEERYRTLFDIAPTGIILEDENGNILEANNMICKSSGYSKEELIGNNVKLFINPEFHHIVDENIRKLLFGVTLVQDVESVNKDNSIHNVELYEKKVLLPNGKYGILSISNYVTERKRAENQLKKERDNLNNILFSSPVGMLVLDEDKTISFANPAAEKLFDKTNFEIVNRKCGDILKCINRNEDNKSCGGGNSCKECKINNAIDIALNKFSGIHDFESEVKIEAIDGFINKWFKVSIEPVSLDNKKHIIIAMSDISELKNTYVRIKENEEKLKTLINASPDIICFKDAEGKWLEANDAILDLYKLNNIDYKNKNELELSDYTADIYKEAFKNCGISDDLAFAKETTSRTDEIIPDVYGNLHHFDVIKVPLYNDDKSRKGLVVYGRDITQMKETKLALDTMMNRIKLQKDLIAEISVSKFLNNGDINAFSSEVTELIAKTFNISQVSIWLLDDSAEELNCVDLFNFIDNIHSKNTIILRNEHKNEFKAFLNSKYIDANYPLSDERTKGLSEQFLIPLQIKSLLDASIVISGKTMGIVCFEFINQEHIWETDEINFACQIADIISIALQNKERISSEYIIKRNEQRLKGLLRISQNQHESIQELLDHALDEIVLLTSSKIGYIYYYDEKTKLLKRNSWSKGVLEECDINIGEESRSYHLDNLGFWGEAIRQRKAIINNDFKADNLLKKGYPNGHSCLHNFLSIPVFADNQIVATVGVANKDEDYDNTDVIQLKLMMDAVWKIVQRKKDEDKIRQLSKGIEQSPAIIIIADKNGVIEYLNPTFTKITGFKSTEIIGKKVKDVFSDSSGVDYNVISTNLLNGKDWQGEFLSKKKNGEYYWVSAFISPILNEKKEITHFISIEEDITEHKKMISELVDAKEKAEQVSLLKSRLLANMSHEIRTPLNGILGFAELMKDDIEDENHQMMAETIHASGTRLMHTLNSILDLSLIETDSSKLELHKKDLNQLAKESSNLFVAMAAKQNLSLVSAISKENMYAILDENLVNKILNNLINNAIKFTKQGVITIKSNYKIINDKEFACIEVHDTGIGIDEKHLSIIFEEFRQASEGNSRAYEGTGLGLNISLRFARLMAGNITVESEVGKGSVFTLWLPAVDHEIEIIDKPKSNANNTDIYIEILKDKNVLLVEDDPDSRKLVAYILKTFCKLDVVENGVNAIKNAEIKKYDAILMDISLRGGISGIETVNEIRKIKGYKKTPIAAFTANAMSGHKDEYLKEGCTHYISKPYTKIELLNLLNEMLTY
jgi:PAS domain S-box-containing protein